MPNQKQINKTRLAEEDLIDIWYFSFSEWGEQQADYYLDELNEGLSFLEDNPELGVVCDDIRAGYRKLKINRHLVFYLLKENEIQIIRVLHESMDVDLQFKS